MNADVVHRLVQWLSLLLLFSLVVMLQCLQCEKIILILYTVKYLYSTKDFVSSLKSQPGLVFLDKEIVHHHCFYVRCDLAFTPSPIFFFFSGEGDDGEGFTVHTHAEAPAMHFGRSGPLDHEPLSGSYT